VVRGGPPGQPAVLFDYDASLRKLYAIEKRIESLGPEQKRQQRQALSLPVLDEFKCWLETNSRRVVKDSLTWKAIHYTLKQWGTLVGYCEDGQLHISNALAENAIRPFAVGRQGDRQYRGSCDYRQDTESSTSQGCLATPPDLLPATRASPTTDSFV
jgi:hypothetical protein